MLTKEEWEIYQADINYCSKRDAKEEEIMTSVALLPESKKLADLRDSIELQRVHVEHARDINRKFHDRKSEKDLKKKMEQLIHLRNIYQERKN